MSALPETRILTDWPALAAIADDWADLHARVGGALYSSPEWIAAIGTALPPAGTLNCVTLWQQGRLVGAAPLVAARERLSKLVPIYRPPTLRLVACKYTGFVEILAETDALRERLVEAMHRAARGAVLDLGPLREGPATDQIAAVLKRCGRAITITPQFESVTIPPFRTSAEHLKLRGGAVRKSLRKARERLDALGGAFEEVDHLTHEILARIEAISARSWKNSAGTGLAADPANARFLAEIAARLDADAVILTIDGTDRAFAASLRHRSTDYMLWTEFDESIADLSPGRLVVWELICRVLDHEDSHVTQDLVRRTHFTGHFADDSYKMVGLRAVPAFGPARLLTGAEAALRRLAGGKRLGRRKSKRRADILQVDE